MAKVMISMPDDVLERIDAEARRRGMSRSGLLRQLAEHELGRPDQDVIDAAVKRIEARAARLPDFDADALIRANKQELEDRTRRHLGK